MVVYRVDKRGEGLLKRGKPLSTFMSPHRKLAAGRLTDGLLDRGSR